MSETRGSRRVAMDLRPLRESRDYRLMWAASSISAVGSQITHVAIAFQVYEATKSTAAVGLLGLAQLVPMLVLSPLGGAFADARDRRMLLLRADVALGTCSILLAVNASLPDPQVWPLYVLAAAQAAFSALSWPALRSATPLLLPRELLPAASALNSTTHGLAHVLGPLLGGTVVAIIGLPITYSLDVLTFVVSLALLWRVQPLPPVTAATRPAWGAVLESLRFLKGRQVLQGAFVVDLNAMIFGMPTALFPAVAASRFDGGASVVGLLYAAPSIGAVLASLTSGWTGRVTRHGRAVYIAVVAWGLSITVFGFADSLWVAVVALAAAGAADLVSAVFRAVIVQTATPPHLIGRLSGVELAVVVSGPRLGDFEAGVLAAATSLRFSIVFGGLACIAGVVVMAFAMPKFGRYDASLPMDEPEPAVPP